MRKMTAKKKILISILAIMFLITPVVQLTFAADDEYYVLNIGASQDADVLNPFTTTAGASYNIINKMYETLFVVLNDGTYLPWLADSWEVNEDATEYIYHLNPAATWSDGETLDADDVVFTFEMLMANDLEGSTVREINTVTKIDAHTVKFVTNSSFFPFLLRSGDDIVIVPEHIWGELDDVIAYTNNEAPLGSGPWLFERWEEGQYIQLKKNPNYWKGEVLIDEINVVVYRSTDAMALALKAGEIDVMGTDPSQVGTFIGVEDVAITQVNYNRLCYMGWNLRRWPFSSKDVRHAIAWAVDRQDVVENAYLGYGTIGNDGYVAPILGGYVNPDTAWKGLGMTDEERYAEANAILDAAGIIDRDGDGTREDADGNECEADFLTASHISAFLRTAEVVQEDCEEIGIKINLVPREIGTIIVDVYGLGEEYDPDFDCYYMTCGYLLDPDYLYMEYFSDPHVMGWNGYSGGYSNSELNVLLLEARATGDIEARTAIVHEIQEIIADDLPALNLRNHVALTAYRMDTYDNWQLTEALTQPYNLLKLEPVGPEVITITETVTETIIENVTITETVTETITEQVEVEKVPGWVYPSLGVLVIVAAAAIIYAFTRQK
jgi:peptide/nickel transport system substrate-binding protein